MKINYQKRTFCLLSATILATAASSSFAACNVHATITPGNQIGVPESSSGTPTTVTLNGSGSNKTGGGPSLPVDSCAWTQVSGSPTVTLTNANTCTASFTAPNVPSIGTEFKFRLTVTGTSCVPSTDTNDTIINISDVVANQAPVASISVSPDPIHQNDLVTLDGTGSSDPDGDTIASYSWEQIKINPTDPDVTLSGANTDTATFTAPNIYPPVTLKFRLTVSDGTLTGTADQLVNITWENESPVAVVNCDSPVDEGSTFTLDGTGSYDPDDGIANYLWSQTLGGPGLVPTDWSTSILSNSSVTLTAPTLTSPLDTMTFELQVTDLAGAIASEECNVKVNDITPPVAAPTQTPPALAGWNNTDVEVQWNWVDAGVGIDQDNCTTTSTSSGEGNSVTLNATCKDLSGNEGSASKELKIDKTKPEITWIGGIDEGGHYPWGYVPAQPTCTATDNLSGLNSDGCVVSGYETTVGPHTLTAKATDIAGNEKSETRTYTVDPWTLRGFYQPVDMNNILNVVKGGATVPLKFEVFAGSTELKDVSTAIKSFVQTKITCDMSSPSDEVEVNSTGGTSLRFDTVADQFIQNWQTPKLAGTCYRVTMTTKDDSTPLVAFFKLK
jgi:hypothetical protein